MRAGVFVGRRNAHHPFDASPWTSRQRATKATASRGIDAGLLRLRTGVDLNIEFWHAALAHDLLGQFGGDFLAVDRLDDVGQRNGFLRLVRLQRPDEMQLDIGEFRFQRRPFGLRLLHAVLAEDALAGLDNQAVASASKVFDTATSVTEPASRPASRSAAVILVLTAKNCSTALAMPISCLSLIVLAKARHN